MSARLESTAPPLPFYNTPPRLFLIKNDGSGSEYMNRAQLDYYLRVKKNDEVEKVHSQEFINGNPMAMLSYFTPV